MQKAHRLTGITYPSGRDFTYTYDAGTWYNYVNRMTGIGFNASGSDGVHYTTNASGRTVRKDWLFISEPVVTLDFTQPNALDRFGRIQAMDFRKITDPTTSTRIQKYDYGYDANGNRTFARIEQMANDNTRSYRYQYDHLNRLIRADFGSLAQDNQSITNGSGQAWNLDLLGNWSGDGTTPGVATYTISGGVPGANASTVTHATDLKNRITSHSSDPDADGMNPIITPFVYDDAGSLTEGLNKKYKYDAWNRVREVRRKSDDTLIATYDYDAIGRRISKTVAGTPDTTKYYYYDGHRIIEEHVASGSASPQLYRENIFGLDYINEVVGFYDEKAQHACTDSTGTGR